MTYYWCSRGSTSINDTAAETFVTAGLSKVLKINNICSEKFEDCGIPSTITTLNAMNWSIPDTYGSFFNNAFISGVDTKAAAFETANGESVIVYYNPGCVGSLNEDTSYTVLPKVCANFVYDLNGTKGPNTVGKDIGFITALYPSDVKVVAPIPAVRPLSEPYAVQPVDGSISASRACTNFDSEYRLPNADELVAMAINNNLLTLWDNNSGSLNGHAYASSSRVPNNGMAVWIITTATYYSQLASHKDSVWCVKR